MDNFNEPHEPKRKAYRWTLKPEIGRGTFLLPNVVNIEDCRSDWGRIVDIAQTIEEVTELKEL